MEQSQRGGKAKPGDSQYLDIRQDSDPPTAREPLGELPSVLHGAQARTGSHSRLGMRERV